MWLNRTRMSCKNRIKRLEFHSPHISNILITILLLGLLLCGACAPAENISKYTGEQVIELARNHSPECRILKPGEPGESSSP